MAAMRPVIVFNPQNDKWELHNTPNQPAWKSFNYEDEGQKYYEERVSLKAKASLLYEELRQNDRQFGIEARKKNSHILINA